MIDRAHCQEEITNMMNESSRRPENTSASYGRHWPRGRLCGGGQTREQHPGLVHRARAKRQGRTRLERVGVVGAWPCDGQGRGAIAVRPHSSPGAPAMRHRLTRAGTRCKEEGLTTRHRMRVPIARTVSRTNSPPPSFTSVRPRSLWPPMVKHDHKSSVVALAVESGTQTA